MSVIIYAQAKNSLGLDLRKRWCSKTRSIKAAIFEAPAIDSTFYLYACFVDFCINFRKIKWNCFFG